MRNWELNRQDEIKLLQARGIIPLQHELDKLEKAGGITEEIEDQSTLRYVYVYFDHLTYLKPYFDPPRRFQGISDLDDPLLPTALFMILSNESVQSDVISFLCIASPSRKPKR